jgi:hypothetical protein
MYWIDSNIEGEAIMHPIGHLFQDIYRNYWGITPGAEQPERRRAGEPPARKRKRRGGGK